MMSARNGLANLTGAGEYCGMLQVKSVSKSYLVETKPANGNSCESRFSADQPDNEYIGYHSK